MGLDLNKTSEESDIPGSIEEYGTLGIRLTKVSGRSPIGIKPNDIRALAFVVVKLPVPINIASSANISAFLGIIVEDPANTGEPFPPYKKAYFLGPKKLCPSI